MNIRTDLTAPFGAEQRPIVERIAAGIGDFVAIRHELHADPELAFQETRTSDRIAELLQRWGYRVTRILGTGLVATLENGAGARLGIRADIDALPIQEATGLPFASRNHGRMHACGHDGHSAILLAAAHELARHRRFQGTLRLIFQPAEEIGQGAKALIEAGLFRDHPVDAIFGLHNWPGEAAGRFGFVEGPALAGIDKVQAEIRGRGGHGAEPHLAVDPVVAAAHVVTALQSVVSRNIDPREMAVVTTAVIHGGSASNVIPDEVALTLSLRSFTDSVRDRLRKRVPAIIHTVAEAFDARAEVELQKGFPAVINHARETALIRQVAESAFGPGAAIPGFAPRTASEDFAFYLHHCPGSFVFVGNGDSAPLHSPEYRFNDDIIAPAAALWVTLAEHFLNGATHD